MTYKINLIRKAQARTPFGCGMTLFQEKINDGLVPPPIKIGKRAVAFYEHEINATLAVTIAGYNGEQIKEFVRELVAKRKELLKKYTHLEAAND
ncbi:MULTISPECIES: AlpA family phage regulatory protein [Pseudoalteromonas]|uniref:helix-turn-helix transcriptional regulator n=1 Tax=Pseudoalteromonas TaxID=53246 RepID=UPI0024BD3BB0|nr:MULTISPECIES: AlpA family phage regulatory protein [Pseudoalteromonas]MDN3406083.1 AlpA family transcriptional regulator [Pseudoalteromonas sp. APC 3218]